jgi:excisionase family DNA binding protein
MSHEMLTVIEVADKTVCAMAEKWEAPAFKVRGQWRLKRDDIDEWIEHQKASARDHNEQGDT